MVELGFRMLSTDGFKGACAFSTDEFLRGLDIPEGLVVAVMVNAGDLLAGPEMEAALDTLFPCGSARSPVDLVRIACHVHEFAAALPAAQWLSERGYRVGFNLMQIADRNGQEVRELARMAKRWPVEVLYFADSMGSMTPDHVVQFVSWFREEWDGPLGIHTHDNMGLALQNTLAAREVGVTWVDSTVTGMGRGPGNARTEELAIEIAELQGRKLNLVPLVIKLTL